MKSLIRRKHTGISLTIAGIVLLSLNFVSYLMGSSFVSMLVLPVSVILLVSGIYMMRQSAKK